MKEYKKLFKNISLMTVSNFGSKVLTVVLVPLYTNILTTSEYGTYDIYATLSSLLLPPLSCNIIESVFRFSIDDSNNKNQVFSIGIFYCIKALLIFSIFVCIIYNLGFFPEIFKYPFLLIAYFTFHMLYELIVRFIRGLEKISDIAVGGVLNTLSLVVFSILFLLKFHLGLCGYFYAVFLSYIIPIIYFLYRLRLWRYFTLKKDNNIKRKMLLYSFPLIFDGVFWWINNVSDRYIITWICGLSITGIYSVSYKFPSLMNTMQIIFSQAWTISAIEELKKGNSNFFLRVYRVYHFLLVFLCSILILSDKLIARLFFAKDFYMAWQYAPFLMVAVVFGGLSQFIEGIFVAEKNTKILAITTMSGAIINIGLNIIMVSKYGAIGAAFSTTVTYFTVWLCRMYSLNKASKIFLFSKRDALRYILIFVEAYMVSIMNFNSFFLFIITIFVLAISLDEIKYLWMTLIKILMTKNHVGNY